MSVRSLFTQTWDVPYINDAHIQNPQSIAVVLGTKKFEDTAILQWSNGQKTNCCVISIFWWKGQFFEFSEKLIYADGAEARQKPSKVRPKGGNLLVLI